MHYYQFNIADYRKDTQHLSPIEHYIYRELIDLYYLDESPIPNKTQWVIRRLRLVSENQKDIENVLKEFFILEGDSWKHDRIEHEITTYQSKAETARANGRRGGRPKKPRKTQAVNLANPDVTQTKANHKPLTKNQEPLTNKETTARVETLSESPPREVCPYQKIINLYHEKLPMCPQVVKLTDTRKRAIGARWKNGMSGLDDWELYFADVSKSKFLTGKVDPPPGRKQFVADIDFLIRESTIVKMQEGIYHG